MISSDLVRKSKSAFNAPTWVVKKKSLAGRKTRWRLVIDYRKLNEKTIPDPYLIPNISEMFDQLGRAKYYHVVDLKSGFHQVKMHPKNLFKTAFSIHPLGRFEFLVLPFGLVNSPRTFQRILNTVLGELIADTCFVFIDDIIVFGETVDEVNIRFYEVAQKLGAAGLKLEPQKCDWLKTEVSFLGHIISEFGIRPDKKNTSGCSFPNTKITKNVREFLGLCNYYRRFIENFVEITKPLTLYSYTKMLSFSGTQSNKKPLIN